MNFAKFLRPPFFIEHIRRLLLKNGKKNSLCDSYFPNHIPKFCKVAFFWKIMPMLAALGMVKAEAAIQRCSLEKVYQKHAASLQENTHAKV